MHKPLKGREFALSDYKEAEIREIENMRGFSIREVLCGQFYNEVDMGKEELLELSSVPG